MPCGATRRNPQTYDGTVSPSWGKQAMSAATMSKRLSVESMKKILAQNGIPFPRNDEAEIRRLYHENLRQHRYADGLSHQPEYGYGSPASPCRRVISEATREKLRQRALSMPRDSNGRFLSPRRRR